MVQVKAFMEILHENCEKLAKMLAEEKAPENKLVSIAAREKMLQAELENGCILNAIKVYEGLTACIAALKESTESAMPVEAVVAELEKSLQKVSKAKDFDKLGEKLISGKSLNESLHISQNCLKALYEGARAIFEKKNYAQAEQAFFALCSFDPTHFSHWVGLGHASFQNKNYTQAIDAYSIASAIDPDDIWPHIWAANCFEDIKDFADAQTALSCALSLEKANKQQNQELIRSLEERIQKIKNK